MLTQVYIHLGVALAGLVSFLSPCVLPLVPPYLGYLERHHHRADDRQGRHRGPRVAARGAGLAAVRAGLHHRVRGARGRRVRARPVGAGAQGRAVDRRRAHHHRLRPAFPRAAARAAALSPGALPARSVRGREPGGRLRHGARLRLRLDALHRPGAGDRADAGGQRGQPRRRRPPAVRLLAGARHAVRPGGGGDRPVRRLPAALPQASAAASRW